ncbi:MAG: DUF3237 family protein [Deltaproteobacteria bacterium]|nr:DUF3237 family protein [Deltaproteobacteria bacterium]
MNDAGGSVAGGSGGTGNAGTNQADGSAEAGSVASNETKTLIPHESWTCNMPDGIVPPQSGAFVFEADYEVGEVHDLGETQYGHRHQIDIVGGTVNGSEIQGDILTGGLDYQLKLSNGALEIEQINVIRTRDGALIYFRNCGTAADEASEVRMVPDFEAPNASPYAWLNSATIVGIREFDMANKKLKVRFFDVSGVVPGSETVRVTKPEGFPNQTWECKKSSGIQGAVVYTETVRIGASLAIGASKYGTRNVIPITGGTTSGGITGEVLVGGGDYQILSPTFEIDARYTLRTNDGELIIVRNCGPLGGLIPVFETRKDGPYAWLNQGDYRSSNPSISIGAVILTIYEAR